MKVLLGIFIISWVTVGWCSYAASASDKVFAGWILHMFISDQLKEYTPRGGMSECLKVKRKILRSQGHSVGTRWECRQGKLVLRKYDTGKTGDQWLPVEHLGND